jgi:quercetin dioxygenase-like cupin family protein
MSTRILLRAAIAAAAIVVAAGSASAHPAGERETVTPNFARQLPGMPGKSLVAVVVDYAPGAASMPHRHAKSAFIYAYVVSGAVETQVNDEPVRIVRAGESFSEAPGARHGVSRNASKTAPARLLAVFVV